MLTKFKLVRTEGLKGLMVRGRFIPFERIDDTMAEQLFGKTHVLERLPSTKPATAPVALALAEASAEGTEAEAPATTSRRAR
jgi:hypothetical protein